jgi:hypothetical protein
MKYHSHITNPTGIKKIEKEKFDISVEFPKVTISKLDIEELELPKNSIISLIAQAGYTEQCFQLGTVGKNKIPSSVNLSDIDSAKPLGFRLIIFDAKSCMIQASCERIRARLESDESDTEPLLSVEPVQLGEKLWSLYADGSEEPVLYVNNDRKLDMLSFFQPGGDPTYRALVIPEALKQSLLHLYKNPDLDWATKWHKWIESLGQLPIDNVDDDDLNKWAEDCVSAYLQGTPLKSFSINFIDIKNSDG